MSATSKKKIIITLGILLFIQALSGIPTPGVNPDFFKQLVSQNSLFNLFNSLSGNGLGALSISALSVTPYITASIILQLLTVVIPKLEKIQKDGESGRKQYQKLNIIAGMIMAVVQSLGFAIGFGKQGLLISYQWYWIVCVAAIWSFTTFIIILLADFIEKKGFGNGFSLVLLCNILSSLPTDVQIIYQKFLNKKETSQMLTNGGMILVIVFLIFAFTVLIHKIEKRIEITYSTKITDGNTIVKGVFPIKLCPGNVMPIIFASTIISLPSLIALFTKKDFFIADVLNSSKWFDNENPIYSIGIILFLAMIFGFTYFYTDNILNPHEIANGLKKSGGCIPDVRAGKETVAYLEKEIKRILPIGALALCIIAIIPYALSGILNISGLSFAGTSMIITVSIILEVKKDLKAEIEANKLSLLPLTKKCCI